MRKNRIVLLTLSTLFLCASGAVAQVNLLSNAGFETSGFGFPWNSGGSSYISNSSSYRIEGLQGALFDHGTSTETSGFSQSVPIGSVAVGRRYMLSANIRFEEGDGVFRLIARFNNDSGTDTTRTFSSTYDNWEKVQIKFTVPAGATSLRVFCRCEGTTGKVYVDGARLIETGGGGTAGANMLVDEDFENATSSWNLASGASITTTSKRFGSKSLKLVGSTSGLSYATQFVNLANRGFDTDKPIFTISAHIKTTGTPPNPVTNVDWDTTGPTLAAVPGVGACMKIDCFNGSTWLRAIYSPFFFSKATSFTEREFSFLVPEGTTGVVVTPFLSKHNFTAYFDNFRLTQWTVSPSAGLVENVGCKYVEAPEAGTYTSAWPVTGIQTVIDLVSTPGNSEYGKVIWAQEGDYFHADLLLRSTTHLKLHQSALLTRDEATGNVMWFGGHVKSPSWGTPISDVILEGGVLDNHLGGEDFPGSAVAVLGDRVVIRNVKIPRYGKTETLDEHGEPIVGYSCSAILVLGHDVYVHNNYISGPKVILGQDGIHFWAGKRAHIMSNQVLAGDDGLGLFPATQGNVSMDRDIDSVEAYNNIFDSVGARSVAVGLARPRQKTYRLLSRVTRVRIRNFTGLCGGEQAKGMLTVQCQPAADDYTGSGGSTSDAQVEDLLIENADIQGYLYQNQTTDPFHPDYTGGSLQENSSYPPVGIKLYTLDVGWIKDTWFENVSIKNFKATNSFAIEVRKAETDASLKKPNAVIRFRDCIIDQATGPTAVYLYRIDGIKWTEVGVLEHTSWGNQLPGPGIRDYTDY